MNTPVGFKQRLGAELALLEKARAERAAEEASGNDMPVAAPRLLARPGVRRTAWVSLAAGVVAAAVVATSAGQGAPTEPVRAMTVAQVLNAAAVNAAKGSDKEPRPDQWVYTDTVVCGKPCQHAPSWVRYDGGKRAMKTPTGDPDAIWVITQVPKPGKVGSNPRETREVLSQLPTDPRKLLERVSADPFFADGPQPLTVPLSGNADENLHNFQPGTKPAVTPGARFVRIVNVLEKASNIPPLVNAALYRALALIPGAKLVSTPMRDAAGRSGVTIAFDFPEGSRTRQYLFLAPRTYAYHGSRRERPGDPDYFGAYARVATGIVDHPGQVPGGPALDPSDIVQQTPRATPSPKTR
ncbi:CU044_5270 family protein [Streptomyces sp. NPDC048332]|uniref:CU044_5270 family protein n=1 Tax=Streptomyces sp. NPDC048332 TaxID=3154619 RepID=UPI00344069D0